MVLLNYGGDTYKLVSGDDKTLTGPVTLTVVDKGFAPASVYKKYSSQISDKPEAGHTYHIAI